MTPERALVERVKAIADWADDPGCDCSRVICTHLEEKIAAFAAEYAREQVASYAKTVDDPARAHLHYAGCPYKPFAELPSWDTPENAPACTCAEEHLGAYWKGQHLLQRSYHEQELTAARQREEEAKGEIARLISKFQETRAVLRAFETEGFEAAVELRANQYHDSACSYQRERDALRAEVARLKEEQRLSHEDCRAFEASEAVAWREVQTQAAQVTALRGALDHARGVFAYYSKAFGYESCTGMVKKIDAALAAFPQDGA